MKPLHLIIPIILIVIVVVCVFPFAVVIDNWQSCSLPAYGSTKLFWMWHCIDKKEAMEGQTVLISYTHAACPAHPDYLETHFSAYKVLADSWDACEHNPDQNHTIAIGFTNKTDYDFWDATLRIESDKSFEARIYNWSYLHQLERERDKNLEFINAERVEGYVIAQTSWMYGANGFSQVITLTLVTLAVVSCVVAFAFLVWAKLSTALQADDTVNDKNLKNNSDETR